MGAEAIEGIERNVRLNSVDWDLLEVMADGRRYTQQYLYDDIEELDEYSPDWIRKRISHLYDNGLIDKVGSSAMYEISEWGLTALEYKEKINGEMSPREAGQFIRSQSDSSVLNG